MDGNAYAEVIEVIDNMNLKDKNKIPKKVYDFFVEKSNKDYIKHLDKDIFLQDQEIREDTKAILAILLISYLCETENEKKQLLELFKNNELNYQDEMREKYNPNNIFKNRIINNQADEKTIENDIALVEYKESIFRRVINKIKSFFHIN